LTRLLRLLVALQADRCSNARELAELCEVSRRTIFRDLETLAQAGIPVRYLEDRRGYQLAPGYAFRSPGLDTREAAALILAARAGGHGDAFGLHRDARTAAGKVAASLQGETRDRVRALAEMFECRHLPCVLEPGRQAVYDALLESMTTRVQVRLGYQEPGSATEYATKVSPYRVLMGSRSWCLIGRSTLHRQVRAFQLPWIRRVELTDDHYQIPPRFNLERFLGQAWAAERGADRLEVWLRFSPRVSRDVAEGSAHPSQRLEPRADGSLDVHLTVDGLDEIFGWVIGFGDQVEVLEPASFRVRMKYVAERIAMLHTPRTNGSHERHVLGIYSGIGE
jgi:predicted DNA-binding transcriptional regulator YafY